MSQPLSKVAFVHKVSIKALPLGEVSSIQVIDKPGQPVVRLALEPGFVRVEVTVKKPRPPELPVDAADIVERHEMIIPLANVAYAIPARPLTPVADVKPPPKK